MFPYNEIIFTVIVQLIFEFNVIHVTFSYVFNMFIISLLLTHNILICLKKNLFASDLKGLQTLVKPIEFNLVV